MYYIRKISYDYLEKYFSLLGHSNNNSQLYGIVYGKLFLHKNGKMTFLQKLQS